MMAQEEQNQRQHENHKSVCNNSSSHNNNNKKQKQKKIPQRGLGVAQLEKIRLEEQHKKEAAVAAAALTFSPSVSTCSSYLPLPPISNFNPTQTRNSPRFHPGPSATSDLCDSGCVRLPSRANGGASHGDASRLWNCEYGGGMEGEIPNLRMDHHGLRFQAPNLPYDCFGSSWPLPLVAERTQQSQQPPPPPPMVSVSEMTSTAPVLSFQSEPPSNQSYCGNFNTAIWPEGDEMIGMKRACPFSLENQAGPSLLGKFPTTIHPLSSRSEESASCENGAPFLFEPINPLREAPSCSTSISERTENNSMKGTKENGVLGADFLTLAPPLASLHQGRTDDLNCDSDSGPSVHPPPFYSFLSPVASRIVHGEEDVYSCRDEGDEGVDLSLKL